MVFFISILNALNAVCMNKIEKIVHYSSTEFKNERRLSKGKNIFRSETFDPTTIWLFLPSPFDSFNHKSSKRLLVVETWLDLLEKSNLKLTRLGRREKISEKFAANKKRGIQRFSSSLNLILLKVNQPLLFRSFFGLAGGHNIVKKK